MKQIVVLNNADNVATSLAPLEADSRIEVDLNTAGERVWKRVVKVASGALTSCEVLNEQQLSVSRFGPSV